MPASLRGAKRSSSCLLVSVSTPMKSSSWALAEAVSLAASASDGVAPVVDEALLHLAQQEPADGRDDHGREQHGADDDASLDRASPEREAPAQGADLGPGTRSSYEVPAL